jgi:hypothetical protein
VLPFAGNDYSDGFAKKKTESKNLEA